MVRTFHFVLSDVRFFDRMYYVLRYCMCSCCWCLGLFGVFVLGFFVGVLNLGLRTYVPVYVRDLVSRALFLGFRISGCNVDTTTKDYGTCGTTSRVLCMYVRLAGWKRDRCRIFFFLASFIYFLLWSIWVCVLRKSLHQHPAEPAEYSRCSPT
jgi:hypothetical protein